MIIAETFICSLSFHTALLVEPCVSFGFMSERVKNGV